MVKTILVTGATGAQGGALVPRLIDKGFAVRALTRNPDKQAGLALKHLGAEVVAGDLDDESSLEKACEGVYGVFSVQNFWEKGVGHDREVEQGCKLARAAKQANVQHFVQTSVANCDDAKGVLHFESKYKIERYIDSLELPRTFLREVFFLENFTQPVMTSGNKKSMDPYWVLPSIVGLLDKDIPFHMVSVEDIAWFAADIFSHPEEYLGKDFDVASDVLTASEMKAIFRKVTGRRLLPVSSMLTRLFLRFVNPESFRQFRWNNNRGWKFDIAPLKARNPNLISLEKFLTDYYAAKQ
ncbi:MAG: NmrA/HSCARG family protein [Pseudomonadales bacterium]|nr:NmrA/HSCARG family protein [Pseudomonadales bacterium]